MFRLIGKQNLSVEASCGYFRVHGLEPKYGREDSIDKYAKKVFSNLRSSILWDVLMVQC
jgi:hypothetical protein